MSYKLIRETNTKHIAYLSCDFNGIKLKPKKLNRKNLISASSLTIVDRDYCKTYSKKMVDKKLKKIYELIFNTITDDDTTTTDVVQVLGETEKFKSIINNKYKEYLEEKEIELIEKKINLLETELKRRIVDLELEKIFDSKEINAENRNKSR